MTTTTGVIAAVMMIDTILITKTIVMHVVTWRRCSHMANSMTTSE